MKISYPQELPIISQKDEIFCAIRDNQVVVIAGETGSGKTTQIPKICYELFSGTKQLIGCTQPRRIAASTVANRVNDELADFDNIVGYKIRFHDYTNPTTRIKFMTDGVLLAETRNDPLLTKYKVIVLDEAHERSLNIDFLLGYLKRILPDRPDLKVIVTSATIDTEKFATHFDDAPVIQVGGRTYPVTVRYAASTDEEDADTGYVEQCAKEIVQVFNNEPPGDILAFLPTEKDIRECCSLVEKQISEAIVLPMFGRLQSGDQRRIFQPHSKPKIVIATNVAETSITVPGIRYVVDSGLARISMYNARAKTKGLPIQRISQASCDQRKGRCGRVGPGICIRLYSEEDYLRRDKYTLPEIQRANLADVILQMISLKLGKPDTFPFIEPPLKSAIRDGYRLLFELGAITKDDNLTETGVFMSRLPIDPCISRVIFEALKENCVTEILIISAALAIQDPRIRPADKEHDADSAHKRFAHKHSDFMSLLNLWQDMFEYQGSQKSWSKLKKYCKANYLSFQRMREWLDLEEQLSRLVSKLKEIRLTDSEISYERVHKALASGFLRNIAVKKEGKIYQGAQNKELMIFPGSHQFLTGGQWILAASFIETNRLYALTVATIEPDWLEFLAPHLVKYSWSNPRWQKKTGQVIADEKVSLFGLLLSGNRKVNFPKRSKKNRAEARSIFIQAALVNGEISGQYSFLEKNLKLINQWRETEDRLRTSGILQDDLAFASFYDSRLPDYVCDRSSLNKYLKRQGHRKMVMSDSDVVRNQPDERLLSDFPTTLEVGSTRLSLQYHFSPGGIRDGVTVRIPLNLAQVLPIAYFEWLVPGLLRDKIQLLIKGLPKNLRKQLVPVNVTIDRILDDIVLYRGSLYQALESSIHKLFKLQLQRSDWPRQLPAHLQFRFLLYNSAGDEVASGRDLRQLLQDVEQSTEEVEQHELTLTSEQQQLIEKWENKTTRIWDFADLPDSLPITTPSGDIAGFLFPMLQIHPSHSGLQVLFVNSKKQAFAGNKEGLTYLYRQYFSDGHKSLKKYCDSLLSGPSAQFLVEAGLSKKEVSKGLLGFIVRALFPEINGAIPDEPQFNQSVERVRQVGFYRNAQMMAEDVIGVIRLRHECYQKLNHLRSLDTRTIVFTKEKSAYFTGQLSNIISQDFFERYEYGEIDLIKRRLKSLTIRLERFYANPAKDGEKEHLLRLFETNLDQLEQLTHELSDEALEELANYRKMVQEYAISVYSPEIKTRIAVSAKKLKTQYQQVRSLC